MDQARLASVTDITNSKGTIVKTYQYDAYGNVLSAPGTLTYNTLTYTARERHVASGLYYYRARFYDPQLGRFITQDPIGHLGGMNLYAYVAGDPLNYADPLGLDEGHKIAGYTVKKITGDIHQHGGPHYHIYGKGGKLLGRVSTKGEVVTGSVPKTLLKKMSKAGLISVLATMLIFPDEVASATLSDYYIEQYKNGQISHEELMDKLRDVLSEEELERLGCP